MAANKCIRHNGIKRRIADDKGALFFLLTLMVCLLLMDIPAYAASNGFIVRTDPAIKTDPSALAERIGSPDTSISDSVIEIGEYAFADCENLERVTLPEGLMEISAFTFANCSSLTDIVLPSSVTKIGESAFSGCTSLKTITIPDHVTEIGESAFLGCTSLKAITIPDHVTEIGASAFSGCTSLTEVTIPKGVRIGKDAFFNTPWLEQRQDYQVGLVLLIVGTAAVVARVILSKRKVFHEQ